MTRERYVLLLPVLVFSTVAVAFILGAIFPSLNSYFYLVYVLAVGGVIVVIDRLARRRVTEALTDERIQGIAGKCALLTLRIAVAATGIGVFVVMVVFPSVEAVRLLGVGALCAIGLQGLIFWVTFSVVRSRT
jgi:uncharacterized membrane protein